MTTVRPAGSMMLLEESMERCAEVADRAELVAYLQRQYGYEHLIDADVSVKPYGHDPRIDWDTHLVTVKGDAVLFSNGPIAEAAP